MQISPTELNLGVVLFLGYGESPMPRQGYPQLLAQFGPDKGEEIGHAVENLLDELGRIDIDWSAHTLASAGEAARAEMQAKHPELSESALRALAWKFTYDWR